MQMALSVCLFVCQTKLYYSLFLQNKNLTPNHMNKKLFDSFKIKPDPLLSCYRLLPLTTLLQVVEQSHAGALLHLDYLIIVITIDELITKYMYQGIDQGYWKSTIWVHAIVSMVRSFCFTRRSLIPWYCGKTIHLSGFM